MERDQLSVEGLRLRCMLGTRQRERMAAQEILVTFSVCTDAAGAGAGGQPAAPVQPGDLVNSVRTYVARAAHELIESLASEIARVLLTDYPIQEATVTVRKPGAFPDADAEAVTLTRAVGYFPKK
jgi:dihydroneopterin aldolase